MKKLILIITVIFFSGASLNAATHVSGDGTSGLTPPSLSTITPSATYTTKKVGLTADARTDGFDRNTDQTLSVNIEESCDVDILDEAEGLSEDLGFTASVDYAFGYRKEFKVSASSGIVLAIAESAPQGDGVADIRTLNGFESGYQVKRLSAGVEGMARNATENGNDGSSFTLPEGIYSVTSGGALASDNGTPHAAGNYGMAVAFTCTLASQ